MGERLRDKVAIIVGAGQIPGDTIGNGRATAITFAREGARLLLVDHNLSAAQDTQRMIEAEGLAGTCATLAADVSREKDCAAIPEACLQHFGRVDILHNNVGILGRDSNLAKITADAWDELFRVNLRGMMLTCKAVLPHMERQGHGAVINISSIAAVCASNIIGYKTSKAGVNALTHALAMAAAPKGVRVNAIMPGAMHTPNAIEVISQKRKISKAQLIAERDAAVPLKGGMGTAWDIANAALFLASDDAKFITSVILPVDGGQSSRIG